MTTVVPEAATNGNGAAAMHMETAENFMKTYDECSTTDSGSALEEDSSFPNGTSVSSTTTTPNDHFMPQVSEFKAVFFFFFFFFPKSHLKILHS